MPEPPRACAALALAVLGCTAGAASPSAELVEPLTLASEHGVLDVLMVARPQTLATLAPFTPVGWVYEICKRPAGDAESCPDATAGRNYYGGTRLALAAGDSLRIHLVNKLPPAANSRHALEPDKDYLLLNPTNLHTHGLLVSPHGPSDLDPTYGDNVFVLTFNPDNGAPAASAHLHAAARFGSTDYTINVPLGHPAGLYWFHPHAHGLSENQITAGLAGIITVGSVHDYLCRDRGCWGPATEIPARHLILKDAQVLADGNLLDQQTPNFCGARGSAPPAPGAGGCDGQDLRATGGADYRGGRWFFTLNGQVRPTLTVAAPRGEVWRLTNASASASYDLSLFDPAAGRDLVLQVISLDGVSVAPTAGLTPGDLGQIVAGKLQPVACPGTAPGRHRERRVEPLCVTHLLMMPSTRAEIWVTARDAYRRPVLPSVGQRAVLRSNGLTTGPHGDRWPPVELASVAFVRGVTASAPHEAAAEFLGVDGEAKQLMVPSLLSAELYAPNAAVGSDLGCAALAPGHRRRVYFGPVPSGGYGMGYEELDAAGVPVAGTFQDLAAFDPARPTVCLPLGPGSTSVKEVWELVNLGEEDHNFHAHQAHFRLLSAAEFEGSRVPTRVLGDGITIDSVPLMHADGECRGADDFKAGLCSVHPVTVEIAFAVAGDFVYHCHILEHEDGGMMAVIRIRPAP